MSTNCIFGYLVVVNDPSVIEYPSNRRYSGVNRIPAYPCSIPSEALAMDEYLFGDAKNVSTNLIPDIRYAIDLLDKFSVSHRKFEVIELCSCKDARVAFISSCIYQSEFLGYDAATITSGGYWSPIADFPIKEWSYPYRSSLNINGLFNTSEEAFGYIKTYRDRKEIFFEDELDIVEVRRVIVDHK